MASIEGDRKYGRNGAGPGRNVQGGGAVGAIIWKQKMGGDQINDQSTDRVPPTGGTTDHGEDGKSRGRRRVEVPIGIGGDESCRDPIHWGVHQEEEGNHNLEGGLPLCLCTVHGGGADAGDEPSGAMVGLRCVK